MRIPLLLTLVGTTLSAPAWAGQPGALGRRIIAAKARNGTERLRAGRARLVKVARGARDATLAAAQFHSLIANHGHETVTYKGQDMTLRQAYRRAKKEGSVGVDRFGKFLTGILLTTFAGVTVALAPEAPLILIPGLPGTALSGTAYYQVSKETRQELVAARRKALSSARGAGIAVPKTALAVYGILER